MYISLFQELIENKFFNEPEKLSDKNIYPLIIGNSFSRFALTEWNNSFLYNGTRGLKEISLLQTLTMVNIYSINCTISLNLSFPFILPFLSHAPMSML